MDKKSLAGYSPKGCKKSEMTEASQHACMGSFCIIFYNCKNLQLPQNGGSVVKNLPDNAGDLGLIPGCRRSPGEGTGNPLQYSCLGNSVDRGAWQATVHGVERVKYDLVSQQQQ